MSRPKGDSDMVGLQMRDARLDDHHYSAIMEMAGLMQSYGISLYEAAWRKDKVTVETHLRQQKATIVAAIDVFKGIQHEEKPVQSSERRGRDEGVHRPKPTEAKGG